MSGVSELTYRKFQLVTSRGLFIIAFFTLLRGECQYLHNFKVDCLSITIVYSFLREREDRVAFSWVNKNYHEDAVLHVKSLVIHEDEDVGIALQTLPRGAVLQKLTIFEILHPRLQGLSAILETGGGSLLEFVTELHLHEKQLEGEGVPLRSSLASGLATCRAFPRLRVINLSFSNDGLLCAISSMHDRLRSFTMCAQSFTMYRLRASPDVSPLSLCPCLTHLCLGDLDKDEGGVYEGVDCVIQDCPLEILEVPELYVLYLGTESVTSCTLKHIQCSTIDFEDQPMMQSLDNGSFQHQYPSVQCLSVYRFAFIDDLELAEQDCASSQSSPSWLLAM